MQQTKSGPALDHGTHLALGSIQGFFGSAISLPTGLITAACLTRWLGPEDYGLLTVTAVIVSLIEISITTGLCRSAEKLVTETDDWQPAASRFIQAQLVSSIIAASLLVVIAPFLGRLLNSPALTLFLCIHTVGIPISTLGTMHQSILISQEQFGKRALLTGVYWVIRMVFIVLIVYQHPTVIAAITASILATAVKLVWARVYIHPPIFKKSDFPVHRLWVYAWPLFFFVVGISLFRQVDLLFVKGLCERPEMAGYYGATKNLTIIPTLVTASLSPLLLAKLTRLIKLGQVKTAYAMARTAIRLIICLLPFAGVAAGAAPEIVTVIYGQAFLEAAPFLTVLIFGALGLSMISVAASILIAAGLPRLPLFLTGFLLPVVIVLHVLLIPRFGAIGAAVSTAGLSCTGAMIVLVAVFKIWGIKPGAGTLLRSILLTVPAYGLVLFWPTPGLWVVFKLLLFCLIIPLSLFLTGEFNSVEIKLVRSLLSSHRHSDNTTGKPSG